MSLSSTEQMAIQNEIDGSDNDKLFSISESAKSTLVAINNISHQRILSADERKQSDIAIEYLVRIDATKKGKGALYRMRKRISLTMIYQG